MKDREIYRKKESEIESEKQIEIQNERERGRKTEREIEKGETERQILIMREKKRQRETERTKDRKKQVWQLLNCTKEKTIADSIKLEGRDNSEGTIHHRRLVGRTRINFASARLPTPRTNTAKRFCAIPTNWELHKICQTLTIILKD